MEGSWWWWWKVEGRESERGREGGRRWVTWPPACVVSESVSWERVQQDGLERSKLAHECATTLQNLVRGR